jgi:phosphotransferase system  glucose/maltose/N-acetylglucosamine-specific IIC component
MFKFLKSDFFYLIFLFLTNVQIFFKIFFLKKKQQKTKRNEKEKTKKQKHKK